MKTNFLLTAMLPAILAAKAWAGPVPVTGTATVNTVIPDFVATQPVGGQMPDFNLTGVTSTINLNNTGISSITGLSLTLDVTGYPAAGDAWNGDYYAYLTHGSDIAILLNRVGAVNPGDDGYGDSGFDITFSATAPDIHDYQDFSPTFNAAGQLTGSWDADGRGVSPFTVTAATAPTALLNSFDGQGADGGWTLFVADSSPGGVGELANWSLTVTGDADPTVPDGASTWLLLLGSCALLLVNSWRYPRKS